MPRPKKAGAPEPKRRSRNGCWPCKSRKVKCDEARPSCLNCQKQGEACDYSIRLNWDGRGKKKGEVNGGFGQVDFSAGMISVGTATQDSEWNEPSSSAQTRTIYHAPGQHSSPLTFGPNSLASEPSQPNHDRSSIPPNDHQESSDSSTIDPALMSSTGITNLMLQDGLYGGLHDRIEHQYTQSYERYRSPTPGTTAPVQPPVTSRFGDQDFRTSPADFSMRNSNASTFSIRSPTLSNIDSPIPTPVFMNDRTEGPLLPLPALLEGASYDQPYKRARYQPPKDLRSHVEAMPPPNMAPISSYVFDARSSAPNLPPSSSSAGTPLTPASSHSDDGYKIHSTKLSPYGSQDSPDLRRLSVNSLLSGPPGIPPQIDRANTPKSSLDLQDDFSEWQDTTAYGIDRGFKDLDIPKNDDANAISGSSPLALRDHLELVLDNEGVLMPIEFGFGIETKSTAFENGGYYDQPVAVCIPRVLEPLPSKLLENKMNLLYFHHFLNHTAGALIPHNCSSNPFKLILPQMAVQNDNLLNLLLAYSASHRARLLRQPEPATRIAMWVEGMFQNLHNALNDPSEIVSNANLATAIMLASLEIISPKAFGVAVPWQTHLDTARQIIAARGGPLRMKTASRGDKVSSFLWSWFSYLDVLGSFSGENPSIFPSAWILDDEIEDENDYAIDCILGFTSRCIRLLAKTAELARVCERDRLGSDQTEWKPSDEVLARAEKLIADISDSSQHSAKPCTHMQSTGEAAYQWDSLEMAATNEAFHWAGMVHIHRRVLGKPSYHADVQNSVREIFRDLYKVRKGSSAEACLLFPMFTAGCDTQDERQRADILERFKSIERFGMTQIHKARTLMERVWETGKPWETLVKGEFFG